jgi:DNA-binding response OmpR family regulator
MIAVVYDDGHLRIDPDVLRVYVEGSEISLGLASWRILLALMESSPGALCVEELDRISDSTRATTLVYINRLRKSIGREYIFKVNNQEGYYFYALEKCDANQTML